MGSMKKHNCAQKRNVWLSRPGYLGVHFELRGPYSFGVDVDIPGHFSVYNALAAIAVCRHFGVTEENIRRGLNAVRVKGRVEPVKVPGNYTLLIDYAHNAVSMENILGDAARIPPEPFNLPVWRWW